MGAQTAGRCNDRNALGIQTVHQILDEFRRMTDNVPVNRFPQSNRHGFDFTNRNTAISQESFEKRNHVTHLQIKLMILRGNTAATRTTDLACGEIDNVGQIAKRAQNLGRTLVHKFRFTHLDEIHVFANQTDIQNNQNAIFIGNLANGTHVFNRERLSANQIGTRFHTNVGDFILACRFDQIFQLVNVHIAFERLVGFDLKRIVCKKFHHFSASQFDMRLGRGEMEIHGNNIAFFDERLGNDMFRCTSLMSRKEILGSQYFFNSFLQTIE